MLEAPSGKTNDRAGRLRGPATYPRASRLRHGISRPCPHGSHDAPQQSDASALSGVAAWRRLSATAPPRATPTMASTTTAPGTTKRPKEPRVRSLRRLCKHLRRHFRSRGPFGQTELYGWGTTLASPLVHEIRSGDGRFCTGCPPSVHDRRGNLVNPPSREASSRIRQGPAA